MKPLKLILRIWIALITVFGFLAGWFTLAHAGKPAPVSSGSPSTAGSNLAPLPTLAPIPQFGSSTSGLQPIQTIPQSPAFSFPQITTRGS